MVNYEALGKYTSDKEKLSALIKERDGLLGNLQKDTLILHTSSTDFVINLDTAQIQNIVTKLTDLTLTIQTLVMEINSNAEKCGKPKVEVRVFDSESANLR